MSRLVPYRTKAPDAVKLRIEQTLATTMYLVQTTGPTSYVVQEQHCDKRHKVLIGSLQSCSCGDADVCIHVLFVLLKVGFQHAGRRHLRTHKVAGCCPRAGASSTGHDADRVAKVAHRLGGGVRLIMRSALPILITLSLLSTGRWTCCFAAGTASSHGQPQRRS